MRPRLLLVVCCMFQAIALPSYASPRPGASLQGIKAQYQQSLTSGTSSNTPILALQDVDYDGVRWSTVRFIFGASHRLEALTMTTRSIGYEELVARVRAGSRPPQILSSADQISPAFQIRVCDEGDGRVTLTYEPATIPA